MLELVKENPRFGYKKITTLLRRAGWEVNKKRVYGLWKKEGLKVPRRVKIRRNKGHGSSSIAVTPAEHINHVWTWDFLSDSTIYGDSLRWLLVKDEYTKECLVLAVAKSWKSSDVVDTLLELMTRRGVPLCIRSDNGPEFIANKLRESFEEIGIKMLYIEPGSPWQNGSGESFVATFRSECLNEHRLTGLAHARKLSEEFMARYNNFRPHNSIAQLTPTEFREKEERVINTPVLRYGLLEPSASSRGIDNSYC